jgi:hypothetical protein
VDRRISTPENSGLTGGGDLSTDRSLSLQKLNIESKTYGSSKQSLSITVDVFGRVTNVTAMASVVRWADIEEVPKTAEGLGLTDVVKTSGDQSIVGEKRFSNLVGTITTLLGSNAANIHNTGSSAIMSEDSVRWLLANAIGGSTSGGVTKINIGNLVIQYGTGPTGTIGGIAVATLTQPLRYGMGLTSPKQNNYYDAFGLDWRYFGPCYSGRNVSNGSAAPRLLSQGTATSYYGLYRFNLTDSFQYDEFTSLSGFWIVFGIV